MYSRILFFDIDGTLLEPDETVSEDTLAALQKAQKNGHKICIASGRSKCNLPGALSRVEWDGYVLASGIYSEYQGEIVADESMERGLVLKLIRRIKDEAQFQIVLESNVGSYLTLAGRKMLRKKLLQSGYFNEDNIERVLKEFTIVEELCEIQDVNKIMYFSEGSIAESIIAEFKEIYDILPNSVIQGEDYQDGEIMKRGVTKALGIERLIGYAGYRQEDVIAFGDGHNDMEMIRYASIGVAMGNSVEALKQAADIVTDRQEENGISKAMTMLGLI